LTARFTRTKKQNTEQLIVYKQDTQSKVGAVVSSRVCRA